jgi:hypothetical protein
MGKVDALNLCLTPVIVKPIRLYEPDSVVLQPTNGLLKYAAGRSAYIQKDQMAEAVRDVCDYSTSMRRQC